MKQQLTISTSAVAIANGKKINVKPWVVVKSTRKKNKLVYPPVMMPPEHHGYIKLNRFDFL
ncbi:MAG TPA: hypothetical protein VJU78_02645 [Chitinophagaceae bacterium]|nr:hypothetical protein [Chitinophagaceae bacterium]